MTDKDDPLRLGVGTVPDPFGLARDPNRQVSDEGAPDPVSPGATAHKDTGQDGDAADDAAIGGGTVRLGELD